MFLFCFEIIFAFVLEICYTKIDYKTLKHYKK